MPCTKPKHNHEDWGTEGLLVIERCETICQFCQRRGSGSKKQKFAWFLRRHVKEVHLMKGEFPGLALSKGWKGSENGNKTATKKYNKKKEDMIMGCGHNAKLSSRSTAQSTTGINNADTVYPTPPSQSGDSVTSYNSSSFDSAADPQAPIFDSNDFSASPVDFDFTTTTKNDLDFDVVAGNQFDFNAGAKSVVAPATFTMPAFGARPFAFIPQIPTPPVYPSFGTVNTATMSMPQLQVCGLDVAKYGAAHTGFLRPLTSDHNLGLTDRFEPAPLPASVDSQAATYDITANHADYYASLGQVTTPLAQLTVSGTAAATVDAPSAEVENVLEEYEQEDIFSLDNWSY